MQTQLLGRRLPVVLDAPVHVATAARHSCRRCGQSCINYDVMLTEQERLRFSFDLWRSLIDDLPEDMPLVALDTVTGQYILNKRENGRCIFLDSENLCIVHKQAGMEVKPLACQYFPLNAVQTPDGLHVSLNSGCRRLIDMNDADPLLDGSEAARLLANVSEIVTMEETLALTPDTVITYDELIDWQNQLLDRLTAPQPSYWRNLAGAAALLLTIPADSPAPSVNWQTMFRTLEDLVSRSSPQRPTIGVLFERARLWLPALTAPNAILNGSPNGDPVGSAAFCASIARQYLEGRQVALHRTARSGWVALLASLTIGLVGARCLAEEMPEHNPGHTLNSLIADSLALFFNPAGQIALTEPNQQALLLALRDQG